MSCVASGVPDVPVMLLLLIVAVPVLADAYVAILGAVLLLLVVFVLCGSSCCVRCILVCLAAKWHLDQAELILLLLWGANRPKPAETSPQDPRKYVQ